MRLLANMACAWLLLGAVPAGAQSPDAQTRQQTGVKSVSAEQALQKGLEAYKSKDYKEAIRWFRKASEQGDAGAQSNLGVMYDNGQGVQQDYVQAVKWYRKAAEQGYADAQSNLGVHSKKVVHSF